MRFDASRAAGQLVRKKAMLVIRKQYKRLSSSESIPKPLAINGLHERGRSVLSGSKVGDGVYPETIYYAERNILDGDFEQKPHCKA